MKPFLVLFILLASWARATAQEVATDSTKTNQPAFYEQDSLMGFRSLDTPKDAETIEMFYKNHDPNKAALYSAILPGLGQAYNKKYWKIPFVWGGIAGFAYLIDWNNDQYQSFKKNLAYEIAQNPNFPNNTPYDAETLKSGRDQYRRNRDMFIIFGVMFYMLNIIDAHVDAHLIEFDVNKDLSVQLKPTIQNTHNSRYAGGLSLALHF